MRSPTHHVCAGSTIAPEVEQPYDHPPACCEHQTGQGGQDANGSFPADDAEDRGGNGRQITQTCLPLEKKHQPHGVTP